MGESQSDDDGQRADDEFVASRWHRVLLHQVIMLHETVLATKLRTPIKKWDLNRIVRRDVGDREGHLRLGAAHRQQNHHRRRHGLGHRNRVFGLMNNCSLNRVSLFFGCSIILFIFLAIPVINLTIEYILGMRCFMPNNYLVWEATRPKSDCSFCMGLDGPIVLPNLTQKEFAPYAYSSAPIIIKDAVSGWRARSHLNYTYLRDLYLRTPGALQEDCQFLHFKSNFMSLEQVFDMPEARATMQPGQKPWYVGWSNCHPAVLQELRTLYPKPHFLPPDAEMPNTDMVFLGWEQGAVMHLDYIPRLMWQAQLRGRKHWLLAPTPECESQCKSFAFSVDAGDAVLVDTRLWYHGTFIMNGDFSLTIQSEYG